MQAEQQPSPQETALTSQLANDRPTIDAAVKSFISLVAARSMTAAATDATTTSVLMGIVNGNGSSSSNTINPQSAQQQVLQVARAILKTVNAFQFSLQDTCASTMAENPTMAETKKAQLMELGIVARLWNGLVQSEQKPSRFLGRRALRLAWPKMDVEGNLPPLPTEEDDEDKQKAAAIVRERQVEWLKEFETLLFRDSQALPANLKDEDDDSALLWSADKGAAELAKRRQRRQDGATERGPVTPS